MSETEIIQDDLLEEHVLVMRKRDFYVSLFFAAALGAEIGMFVLAVFGK